MANKVITISSNDSNKQKNIQQYSFLDVSMLSKQYSDNEKTKLKVANLKDIEAIKNSLHNIFTWIPGERILNPEFGCNLRRLLYNGITEFNKEQIAAEVSQSVSKWEPRVKIEKIVDVGTVDDTENNTVCLDIIFSIPELNNGQYYKYSYVSNKSE